MAGYGTDNTPGASCWAAGSQARIPVIFRPGRVTRPRPTVAQWQPPGPQRWEIDVSGNRVPGTVPAPGE
jgi:hypothetical protein